jgi:hypothetical protein
VNVGPDGNAVPTGAKVATGAAVAGAAVAGAAVAGAAVAGAAVAGAAVAGAIVAVGVAPPQAESANTKAKLRKARRTIILRIVFLLHQSRMWVRDKIVDTGYSSTFRNLGSNHLLSITIQPGNGDRI